VSLGGTSLADAAQLMTLGIAVLAALGGAPGNGAAPARLATISLGGRCSSLGCGQ
jgi:hypothetical protein